MSKGLAFSLTGLAIVGTFALLGWRNRGPVQAAAKDEPKATPAGFPIHAVAVLKGDRVNGLWERGGRVSFV
jgi:hypothetical protein